ncbi:MAG: GNAT family N-acetyltransferase [Actinomycetota bacterium]|nr:GNAT family N-acetyltransferase [Actinomycetota bacterium]
MQVSQLDVHDDDLLRRYWQVGRDGDAFGRPYAAFGSMSDMIMQLRDDSPAREVTGFVATDDTVVVGGSPLVCPRLDNQHLAYAEPIVRPQSRNRGVGTAILTAIVAAMRERGRDTLIIEAHKPLDEETSAGWSFLSHRGFKPGILDVHRVLDLPVPADRLDELGAAAAPFHPEYQLVTWQGVVPAEFVQGVCSLQGAFNSEAPMGELDLEPEVWTEKRLRDKEERLLAMGRVETATVALAPDGTVAALTEMMITESGRGSVFQGGTLVLRPYRGHRLGIATKVASLRRFQSSFPDARMVHSWNAEENGPMVAINDALGFRAVEHLAEMQLKL